MCFKSRNWYEYYGLYDDQTKLALPLRQILIDAKINEYIAEVSYSQIFYNDTNNKIEADYFFPISSEACFHRFQAKFGEVIIQGTIKEKTDAQKQYEEQTKKGDLMVLAKLSQKNQNVMCVRISNIPPGSEIEIKFSYIERVEVYLNKLWKFTVFSQLISPDPQKQEYDISANVPDSEKLIWNVDVLINSRMPILFIKSISHEVETVHSESDGCYSAKIRLVSEKRYIPDQDFVLLYSTKAIGKPNYLLSPFDHGYCMFLHFFPDLSYFTFDDAFKVSLQGKDPIQDLIAQSKREFIFLVDEANTRDDFTFSLTKEVLLSFIEKLLDGVYFNILGIGKSPKTFGKTSVQKTEETWNEAQNYIKTPISRREIEKPGTQGPIEFIESCKPMKDHKRIIFVLTLGMINKPSGNVLEMLQKKVHETQIFVVGIRNSNLGHFNRKVSIENHGLCEVIKSKEEISEKVSYLLRNAQLPYFTDFSLKIDGEGICLYVIPLPMALGYITPNKLVEFFVVFNRRFKEVKKTGFTLKFFNSLNERYEEHKGEIDIGHAEFAEPVVKMGMFKFCESLLLKERIYESQASDIDGWFKKDVSQKLIAACLKYGILTAKTAFICTVKRGDDTIRQVPTKKITISRKKALKAELKPDKISFLPEPQVIELESWKSHYNTDVVSTSTSICSINICCGWVKDIVKRIFCCKKRRKSTGEENRNNI